MSHDLGLLRGAPDVLRSIAELDQSVLDALPLGFYVCDAKGAIQRVNRKAAQLWGRRAEIGENADRFCGSYRLYDLDGNPVSREASPMAVALRDGVCFQGVEALVENPDGRRWIGQVTISVLLDEAGEISGAINCFQDVTTDHALRENARRDAARLVESDARHRTLIDELNHRVKNTLATVQSIAMQTLTDARSLEQFKRDYEGRLVALSRAHDLLTSTRWRSAELRALVSQELDAFGRGRFHVEGEAMELSPRAAVTLGMIVHELATNAAKHGALSAPQGRVSVRWRIADERLTLEWTEAGGPAPCFSGRRGFGARLLERGVTRDLAGETTIDFRPEGLACTIALPLAGNLVV